MNFQAILGELLSAGQDMTQQVSQKAQDAAGIPAAGAERNAMLSGLGKGAAATAVLGLLLGTKTGRGLGGSALKIGGVAALGTLAYKSYQNWQNNQASDAEKTQYQFEEVSNRPVERAEQSSRTIIRAMLMAAKADGHIDAAEQQAILSQIGQADAQTQAWLQTELNAPVDPTALANEIGNDTALAAEVYLASRMVVGDVSRNEQVYLNSLAQALHIPLALIEQVELEVQNA